MQAFTSFVQRKTSNGQILVGFIGAVLKLSKRNVDFFFIFKFIFFYLFLLLEGSAFSCSVSEIVFQR